VAIFIDTWGWLTLRDRREARHREVDHFYREVRRRRDSVYTSDYVLDETITLLFRRLSSVRAEESLQYLQQAKTVKQHLGFEDVATSGFDAVMSHVHWVYCAHILLSMAPPGVSAGAKSLGDKQRQLQQFLENHEKRRVLQQLTQIGGVQRYTDELRQALADA
jgi:predicted nucleic acid-binding protein